MEENSQVPEEPDPIATETSKAILAMYSMAGCFYFIVSVVILAAAELISHHVIVAAAIASGIALLICWGTTVFLAIMISTRSQSQVMNGGPVGGEYQFSMSSWLGTLGLTFIVLALMDVVVFSEFSRFVFMTAGGFSSPGSGISPWLQFGFSQLADGLSFGLASIYIDFDAIKPISFWSATLIMAPYRLMFSIFIISGVLSAFKAIGRPAPSSSR